MDLTGVTWRKSSYSGGNGGTCVEVAVLSDSTEISEREMAIRDSKNPNGPSLIFDLDQWRAFTTGIHHGEFDLT
jgi:Domain of unknown function (DUF397)